MTKVTLDLKIPASWSNLSDKQLRYVFALLLEELSMTQIKVHCLLKWGQLRVVGREGALFLIAHKGKRYLLSASQINDAIGKLDYIENIPGYPVRLSHIGRHKPCRADFQDVSFGDFITLDNLYQGYLQNRSGILLRQMAQILYRSKRIKLDRVEELSVFYWFASVKQYLSHMFPHFLKVVRQNEEGNFTAPTFRMLLDQMNAQIRALTGGDITKEDSVMKMDCWRAFTELEAKAKEYEEMKRVHKL